VTKQSNLGLLRDARNDGNLHVYLMFLLNVMAPCLYLYSELIRNQSSLSPKTCRIVHDFRLGLDCFSFNSL